MTKRIRSLSGTAMRLLTRISGPLCDRIAVLGARPSTMLGTALSAIEGRSAPGETGDQPRAPRGYQGAESLGWLMAFTGLCLTGLTARPDAHHSFAMYDQTVTKTMSGKLVRLIPGGSHSQFVFDVIDAEGKVTLGPDGKPLKWQVELGSGTNIARQGVTVKTFTPGTILTVTFYPQRNGANQGAIAGPLVLCGMTLPPGGCTPKTGTIMKPPAN